MEEHHFRELEQGSGMSMKTDNTIIPRWPTKLKLRPGQEGAQEEFDILAASAHAGVERYVEWKRTAESSDSVPLRFFRSDFASGSVQYSR
jgi:hypothetical protein